MRERRAANPRDEKKGPSRVFSQLSGHFRVSLVSLNGLTKRRDCSKSKDAFVREKNVEI